MPFCWCPEKCRGVVGAPKFMQVVFGWTFSTLLNTALVLLIWY